MTKSVRLALGIVLTVLSAGMTAFIFYNSSLDAVESTERSDAVMELVNSALRAFGLDAELGELVIRKAAHFIEFFTLGGLLCGAVYSFALRRGMMLCIALPIALAVAVCDELIQTGSSGRSCSLPDMALDFTAALTAALILFMIIKTVSHKKKEGKRFE